MKNLVGLRSLCCGIALLCATGLAAATSGVLKERPGKTSKVARSAGKLKMAPAAAQALRDGEAEARLIEVYKLVAAVDTRAALERAEALVRDHPNFHLAQLVYGDLLAMRQRPVRRFGDVPDTAAQAAPQLLSELREESALRLRALRERPPPGAVPAQFVQLSPRNRHAIAIDSSRARLYLFENGPGGMKLVADYYISVGKAGIGKAVEGDARTPLGVYFITSNLDPTSLKDLYGAGALPINYPNAYDVRRGKTGSGIWLHGTPSDQFSRAPRASDGCIVLANPDLMRLVRTVEVRTTPVVIAQSLEWVAPEKVAVQRQRFADVLEAWRQARASGQVERLRAFYTDDVMLNGKSLAASAQPVLKVELTRMRARDIEMKDLSVLQWSDSAETMVVTFGEVAEGERTGPTKRQYWVRQGPHWKIFFEGVIS